MTLCERCNRREACRVIGATRIEPNGAPRTRIDTGTDGQAPLAALGLLRMAHAMPRLVRETSGSWIVEYWQHSGWLGLCAECYGRVVR